jgi:uncharacterized protein (DUF362 family)/Pyruvate/2-oxoacid:ferredoxin oxidoreductase delta subunit
MVSVASCPDYSEKNCRRALETALAEAGGLDWVKPGMQIGIKANLVSMMKPEAAATTHPALICALVRMLRERGADVVVGDSPGGLFNAAYVNRIYAAAGMKEVRKAGARLNDDYSVAGADFPGAAAAKKFEYTAWLDGCDAVINFCKLKTHGMMGMSAAVKNMFGAIPGTRKPEMHYQFPDAGDFADMLVDLNEYFRPALHIVDAVVGMEGNGPTMGTPRSIGCVVAGKSPYEVDQVCARIIGVDENDVPTMSAARRRGLAPESPAVAGDITPFVIGDFAPAVRRDIRFMTGSPLGGILSAFLRARPALVAEKCIGCAKCAEVCPAGAITMKKRRPMIARRACISCFCCQEFCPRGAMISKRPAVARLLSK